MPVLRHLRNPLPQQRRAFLVNRRASEFGHRDSGLDAFEAIDEEAMVGIAGLYRELHAAAAASRRGRALADAEAAAFRVGPAQEQVAVRRDALRIVARGAIAVEIGPGALVGRAGRRAVPARHRPA